MFGLSHIPHLNYILSELKKNGSPDSIIEADDEHTYFIIRIPCHPEFVCEELGMDKEGHILPIEEIRDKEKDVTENVTDNVTDNVTEGRTAKERRNEILRLMKLNPKITTENLASILHVSRMTISRDINLLRANNKVERDGDDYGGKWIVIE